MVLRLGRRDPLVELASIVMLVWIGQIKCLIDKEKDLEGLVTDTSIDTHEIPLKYDLFRERVLPELLQTVPDDIMEDYINRIPELDITIDPRHTTIVYRHDHLYYTAPHDLYRKLRYYKWKFRSRRRRTTPTPEPSFTLNEKDLLELRNQVNKVVTEKHELVDPDNPPTMWFTRNTHTHVYPPQRLHSVILKKQFFDKKVPANFSRDQMEYAQGRVTNTLLEFIGMTFKTKMGTIRRLNRTVTFIPFRIGSWRTSSWYPVTTAYYMYPNYTLPSQRTRATDMYDYDVPIFPMVTSKPFAILDEEENRKRFSLAIVERLKQRELQIAMRTVNTSYLKYVMKPYKYPTVLVGPTLPSTPAPHYLGYKQWFTKEAPSIVTHSIEVLKASKNHTVKMMNMDLEDDLFDMDINDLVTETKITESETGLLSTTTENDPGHINDRQTTNVNAEIQERTTNMEYVGKEGENKTRKKMLGEIETRNDNGDNPANENNGNTDNIDEKLLSNKSEKIRGSEDAFNYNDDSETPHTEIKVTKKRARKAKRTTKGKRKGKKLSDENEYTKKGVSANEVYDDNINDNYPYINENDSPNYNEDGDTEPNQDSKAPKNRGRKKVNLINKLLKKYEQRKKPMHHVEKRSLTTTRVGRDGSKEVIGKPTKETYSNFNSLQLKKLSRTKSTKVISIYTFRTRKIPNLKRKLLISRITSKKCETKNMGVQSTEKTTKQKTAHKEKTTTRKSSTMGLGSKSKKSGRKRTTTTKSVITTVQKSQTKKKGGGKTTKQKMQEEIKGDFPLFDGEWKDPFEDVTKGKTRKKSRAERQEELLHMLYPPVTLHDESKNLEYTNYLGKLTQEKLVLDESEGSKNNPKRRKKINEEEEEFLNQIYQPVTLDKEWVKEYERRLRPTIPQNMSKNEYVRGFYTYGTSDENVETCICTSLTTLHFNNNTTLHNQAGHFSNDTNLFSSQEKIKFQEVINLYNMYAKEFIQEASSTRKSRKKTTEATKLKVNTKDVVMLAIEQSLQRTGTRPYIQCNWSNFIYY